MTANVLVFVDMNGAPHVVNVSQLAHISKVVIKKGTFARVTLLNDTKIIITQDQFGDICAALFDRGLVVDATNVGGED